MCISDWRAGRFMRSSHSKFEVASGSPIAISANRQRVGIVFATQSGELGAGDYVQLQVQDCVIGSLTFAWSEFRMTINEYGDIPTKEIVIYTSLGDPVEVGVHETFLTEEFLNAGTEQWKTMLLGGRR